MEVPFGSVSALIAVVAALGTASFGLLDAFKALPGGGISGIGFKFVRKTIGDLAPGEDGFGVDGLSRASVLYSLRSYWINVADRGHQLNIAKQLILLRLNPATANVVARATGVDPQVLGEAASNRSSGTMLTSLQNDVYKRFDIRLTILLEQAYHRADQRYRNAVKLLAILVSITLALITVLVLKTEITIPGAILLGLVATPIALAEHAAVSSANNISTAITTATNTIRSRTE